MPRLHNSIQIQAPARQVFNVTNDIRSWPLLFAEYEYAEVISEERVGRYTKLVFSLSTAKATWRSWRLLDHEGLTAIAERIEPMFPFVFMHLRWSYTSEENGTTMTWIQDFELDPLASVSVEEAITRMSRNTVENQGFIKKYIEDGVGR